MLHAVFISLDLVPGFAPSLHGKAAEGEQLFFRPAKATFPLLTVVKVEAGPTEPDEPEQAMRSATKPTSRNPASTNGIEPVTD
jgi:hypothetical protein